MSDDIIQLGTVIDGRYAVESRIGAGGYSEVLAAHDRQQDRPVALKILHAEATDHDPDAVARMRQEAEILRAVHHPNIVQVFDLSSFQGGQMLVMERIDGQGLDELLEAQQTFDTDRLLPLVHQLLDALATAHGADILHRDLKPANIMIHGDRNRESITLVDFGVAKAKTLLNTDDPDEGITLVKTRAGNFVGTPRYSAPEIVVGDPPEQASDLFCVGLIVYEALTGTPLIRGTSQQELMNQLVFPEPFDLSEIPSPWDEWLEPILEKSPSRRMARATEAIASLQEYFPDFDIGAYNTALDDTADDNPSTQPPVDQDIDDDDALYPVFGQSDSLDPVATDGEVDSPQDSLPDSDLSLVDSDLAAQYEPTVEQSPPDMSDFEPSASPQSHLDDHDDSDPPGDRGEGDQDPALPSSSTTPASSSPDDDEAPLRIGRALFVAVIVLSIVVIVLFLLAL